VIEDALTLTTYFGERDRTAGAFLADALVDAYARHRLRVSLLLRGVEGFGVRHHVRTDRLLTLSEDLPLVSVAVDVPERIEAVLGEVEAVSGDGLITLERGRLLGGHIDHVPPDGEEEVKLTVYAGRRERAGGRAAHLAIVDVLHRHGVAGASVLLGVDGTVHGHRRRARFAGGNAHVPLMVVSVGSGAAIAAALADLEELLTRPLATLERVRVCKRDGRLLEEPPRLEARDAAGLAVWQKLTVFAGTASRHAGRPLHREVVRRLRAEGALGATVLRGVWGYHGDHTPHGDRLWQVRRRVPVVCVVVDTPDRSRRWFEILDELTDEAGLVTAETVPAFRASGPGIEHGGLRLARPG
jgi:PII-like signaling protein